MYTVVLYTQPQVTNTSHCRRDQRRRNVCPCPDHPCPLPAPSLEQPPCGCGYLACQGWRDDTRWMSLHGQFGRLASLLLREPRTVPIDEYRASCLDVMFLCSGGRVRSPSWNVVGRWNLSS